MAPAPAGSCRLCLEGEHRHRCKTGLATLACRLIQEKLERSVKENWLTENRRDAARRSSYILAYELPRGPVQ